MVIVSCTFIICVALVVIFVSGFDFSCKSNKRILKLENENSNLRSNINEIHHIALYARQYTDAAKLKIQIDKIIDVIQ